MGKLIHTVPRAASVMDRNASRVVRAGELFALAIGSTVNGRYRVDRHLGRGGMGTVYKVHDLARERALALKTVVHAAADVETLAMLRLEFRHAAALHHPNAAEVYDFEVIAGTKHCLFTMDLVEGKDAFEATEGASWETVVELLVQLCRCLSYVHSRRLIHFDIKPANMMVTPQGLLKVLDFGISSVGSDVSGEQRGTPNYLAPELVGAGELVDHRVDLYSAGITAFVLLCRRHPFEAQTVSELVRMHAEEPIVFAPEHSTPEWLRTIVVRMCAKRPEDRFPNANAIIDAINRGGGLRYELETRQTRESYLSASQFVGRGTELQAALRSIRQRLEHGSGPGILLLGGPSGIGKSRLMREVRQGIQLSGHFFVEANCYDGSLAEYEPIAQSIAVAARIAAAAAKDLIVRHGAELAKLLPTLAREWGIAPSAPLDPARERARLLDTLVAFFVELAAHTPYVLYVNDLQWADARSIDVLHALSERLSGPQQDRPKLALIGSFRDDELQGRPVSRLLSDALGERITLRPFEKQSIRELVLAMLGVDGLPELFVDRIFDDTAGNPLFVEEVMRSLVDTGAVFLREGRWAAANVGQCSVPERMAELMLRRVALLESGARDLLSLLAAYARPMSYELLCAGSETSPEENERHLAELLDRQMVEASPDAFERAYRVSHDRMRECVYAALDTRARRALHQRIAISLERDETRIEERVFELARHAAEANDAVRVRRYGLTAALKGQDQYAVGHARDLIDSMLAVSLPNDDGQIDADRIEALAEIHYVRGGLLYAHGRVDEALREHRIALECAERAGSAPLECQALSGLAECEFGRVRFASAVHYHDRAIARASGAGLRQIEVLSRAMRCLRLYLLQVKQAQLESRDAIALAVEHSFSRAEVLARTLLVHQQVYFASELDDAKRECDLLMEASKKARLEVFELHALHYLGRLALHSDRRAEAARYGREACDRCRGQFDRFMLPWFLASYALAEENDERADELLAEGEGLVTTGTLGMCSLEFCADAMELRMGQGSFSEVERYADLLDALCAAEPVPWASFVAARGRALASFGRGQRTKGLQSELLRLRFIAGSTPMPFALPAIDAALAGF